MLPRAIEGLTELEVSISPVNQAQCAYWQAD